MEEKITLRSPRQVNQLSSHARGRSLTMRAFYVAFLLTFAPPSLWAQDLPLEVPKIGLPKSAVCTVCRSERRADSERRVAVGLRYHSKVYYFCSHREAD